MTSIQALPNYWIEKCKSWQKEGYEARKAQYHDLADNGQHPRAMVISCSDSRVLPTQFLESDIGDVFMHRNIANLVPPVDAEGINTGTAAAVLYAVTALNVKEIIVIGHSACGGIKGCFDICAGNAAELEASFVGQWMASVKDTCADVTAQGGNEADQLSKLERASVLNSLSNLMGYDFVADAVNAGDLSLHGMWFDIRDGQVEYFDPAAKEFVSI